MTANGKKSFKTALIHCARCGHDHDEVMWFPFTNPIVDDDEAKTTWQFWGICPELVEPVLLRQIAELETPETLPPFRVGVSIPISTLAENPNLIKQFDCIWKGCLILAIKPNPVGDATKHPWTVEVTMKHSLPVLRWPPGTDAVYLEEKRKKSGKLT
jgi:hypothetical protein